MPSSFPVDLRQRKGHIQSDVLLQATVEHVSQAVLFLEDAGDLGQALNTDVDEMSMDEQVHHPAALHVFPA